LHYLLDTNVLSELVKPKPSKQVVHWVARQSPLDFEISCMTLGEISSGIQQLPAKSARRLELESWLANDLTARFAGRIHAVDTAIAEAWGGLMADANLLGRPLPVIDALLLATAKVHRLIFVTRHQKDFADRGVAIFNPWS
jgi:predicted nucleic acid-binding protein